MVKVKNELMVNKNKIIWKKIAVSLIFFLIVGIIRARLEVVIWYGFGLEI